MSEVLSLYLSGFLTYIVPPVIIVGIVYFLGKSKAQSLARQSKAQTAASASSLHSRPPYHGAFLAFATFLPAIIVFMAWSIAEGPVIRGVVNNTLPASVTEQETGKLDLVTSVIGTIQSGLSKLDAKEMELVEAAAKGDKVPTPVAPDQIKSLFESKNIILAEAPESYLLEAALKRNELIYFSTYGKYAAFILLSLLAFFLAYSSIKVRLRARNNVETIIQWFLILASTIAIVTTFGILFSVLFETIKIVA